MVKKWLLIASVTTILISSCSGSGSQVVLSEREPFLTNQEAELFGSPLRDVTRTLDDQELRARAGARPGQVEIQEFVAGRTSSEIVAIITIFIYDKSSNSAAHALWQNYPPEKAHGAKSLNLADRTPAESAERVRLGQLTLNPLGIDRSSGICLASPQPSRPDLACLAAYGWFVNCDWVLEVKIDYPTARLGTVDEPDYVTALSGVAEASFDSLKCNQ